MEAKKFHVVALTALVVLMQVGMANGRIIPKDVPVEPSGDSGSTEPAPQPEPVYPTQPSADPIVPMDPVSPTVPSVSDAGEQPVVSQPPSSSQGGVLGLLDDPWTLELLARWGRVTQAMEQNLDERSDASMATFAQTVQAYGQQSFERMANDLARYASMSDAQRLVALDRAKANARKPADGPDFGISSESVSRESAGAMSGSLIDANGAIVGTVQLTASKVKQVSGEAVCDVTVQTINLNGQRTVSKVKGVSASEATLDGLGLNAVLPGAVGGDLKVGGAYCCVNFSAGFGQLDVVTGLLPLAEPIRCDTKGKWKLDKAAKVKLAKGKDGTYALSVDRQKGKTNVSGLKLTYKPKTGVFTGSFKLYALGGTSDRPKLVTRQVKVSGLVVDGIGNGTATVAGTDLVWPVLIITE